MTSLTGRRSCGATTAQLTSRSTPSWRSRARTRSPSSGPPEDQPKERGKFNRTELRTARQLKERGRFSNCSIYLGKSGEGLNRAQGCQGASSEKEASSTTVTSTWVVWRGLGQSSGLPGLLKERGKFNYCSIYLGWSGEGLDRAQGYQVASSEKELSLTTVPSTVPG